MTKEEYFKVCLSKGKDFVDYSHEKVYHFQEYKKMKENGWPASGVYITNKNGFLVDIWMNDAVMRFVTQNNLQLDWLEKAS